MKYGLIGEHLSHSYSREIHESIAGYEYELIELAPDEVDGFMRNRDFLGINVTIPYKEKVMPYLDVISDDAKAIGAVNTVVNKDGRLYGYNTDFAGMTALINRAGIDLTGKKTLVLGTGGTSKTARAVAAALGADPVITVSRGGNGSCTYDEAAALHSDAKIIINTTPVGMYPNTDGCPIDIAHFAMLEGVVDAIYHPLNTNLVIDARERGIKACGGLYMLVAQAVYASALFTGTAAKEVLIDRVFEKITSDMRNIALIGMPTCGKTTVGEILASMTRRESADLDDIIEQREGRKISDIFASDGEGEFRRIERGVTAEYADKKGIIISTGGGCILDARNVRALRRNSVIVFIDRSPDRLVAAPDRPLSADKDALRRLYGERYDKYRAAADITVDGDSDAYDVAKKIYDEVICR